MALDGKTMIPVYNKRSTAFVATLRNGEYYEWLPAKDGFEDMIELNFRDIQQIHATSVTFSRGYLFIDNEDARKQLGLEKSEVKANLVSRADIEKALKAPNNTALKKILDNAKKAENPALLREIALVTRQLKVENTTKLQMVSEVTGSPMDVLIDNE